MHDTNGSGTQVLDQRIEEDTKTGLDKASTTNGGHAADSGEGGAEEGSDDSKNPRGAAPAEKESRKCRMMLRKRSVLLFR